MNPDVQSLFHRLRGLSVQEQDRELGSVRDETVKEEVRSLLRHDAHVGSFLDPMTAPPTLGTHLTFEHEALHEEPDGLVKPGDTLGSYTIVELLGEGGMGSVWRARQDRPSREVALKLMRPGFVSREAMRRFTHEAEILGKLQHPGIAQVFQAGVHAGVPFFAMELVKGSTLTAHAKARGLDPRGRLELFIKVCDAVHHAHTRGVIHRDLKPGNILVAEVGHPPQAQPKVLDFGIARATDADMRTATLRTDVGQLIGTVPYMSPEQVTGDPDQVDTRSDVYALGVVLYELLCGSLPYRVDRTLIHEAVRIIREETPSRLGTRDARLRGDIETIVGKALEKDKDRRYQSAADLADDLRRHLNHEPIVARPPSTVYQFRKFAQRNRVLVGGAAATLLALVAGLIGTAWQLGIARAARADAETALSLAEQRERDLEQVVTFQQSMLAGLDPAEVGEGILDEIAAQGGETEDAVRTLRDGVNAADLARSVLDEFILARASAAAGERFADQPMVEARLRETAATTYYNIGLFHAALAEMRRGLELSRAINGATHRETLGFLHNVGFLTARLGPMDEAIPLLDEALAGRRSAFGDEAPETLSTLGLLANVYDQLGRFNEAEPLLRQLVSVSLRTRGPEHAETLTFQNNLAAVLRNLSRNEEALAIQEEVLAARRRVLGNEDRETLIALNNAGATLEALGRLEEAEAYLEEALETRVRLHGRRHTDTLISMNNLAKVEVKLGRLERAEALAREALEGFEAATSPDHPNTLTLARNLADVISAAGRESEAEAMYRRAWDGIVARLGPAHPLAVDFALDLAGSLGRQGRYREAVALAEEATTRAKDAGLNRHADDGRRDTHDLYRAWVENGGGAEAEAGLARWAVALDPA